MNRQADSQTTPKRRRKWRGIDYLVAVVLLVVLIFGAIAAVNYIKYLRLDMVRAENGTATISAAAQVVVIRYETLVYASGSGTFKPTVAAGEKVKAGSIIGYMENSANNKTVQNISTNIGGLVFYDLDGWEELLHPDNTLATDWAAVFERLLAESEAAAALDSQLDNLGSGRRVARIVDNLSVPYFCFYVEEDISEYINNNKIRVRFSDMPDTPIITLYLTDSEEQPQGNYIIAKYSVDEPFFHSYRYGKADIVRETVSGISIPASALFRNQEDIEGVYRQSRKEIAFKEVEVLYNDGEIAIVNGLKATDNVVANPEKARVGQKVY